MRSAARRRSAASAFDGAIFLVVRIVIRLPYLLRHTM
jgi:hypothetical protein